MRVWLVAVALAACSERKPAHEHEHAPSPADALALPTAIVAVDNAAGHLDEDAVHHVTPGGHQGPTIDVILRSTPARALAAVDGVPLGPTPAYWSGTADGREHEFTFALAGHAIARYRFVPITSGVVHARLEPVSEGAPEPPAAPDPDPNPVPVPTPTPVPAPVPAPAPPPTSSPTHVGPLPF